MNTETAVRYFLLGIGIATGWAILKFIQGLIDKMRKGNLYEISLEEKAIRDRHDRLNDDELVAEANKSLGLGRDSQTKKGSNGTH